MFIANFRSYSCLFALGALSGCQQAAVVAPTTPSTSPAKAAAVAPPAPAASVTPVSPSANVAAADPSPFVEAVRIGYGARLNIAGQRAFLSTEKLLLGVQNDTVSIDPALLEGLQLGRSVFPRVYGNMPESGWAVQTSYAERTSRSSLSRWTGAEWVDADSLLQGKNVIGISAWSNGRTLALVSSSFEKQLHFVQLGGVRGTVPQLARTARDEYGCVHGLQPAAMSALPSGEVYLAGTRCTVSADQTVTNHGVVINSWAPGQARAKTSVLPGLSESEAGFAEINSIVATSGSDVFVAGVRMPTVPEGTETQEQAYVAHFDGKAWRTFAAPPIERIDELQRAPSGKLWALSTGTLWRTTSVASENAVWEQVALPKSAEEAGENPVSSFWVQDDEQVWATLGAEDFTYVVRTNAAAAPLVVPSNEQVAQLSSAFDPMAAYQCESPTLVLVALSRQAPKDADMPSVRAALRGHAELEGKVQLVELPFLTRRYLGARGDMDSLIATNEILSNANIPGVAPEMRCINETPTRTLTLDFSGPKPDPSAPKRARTDITGTRPAPFVVDLSY